MDKLFDIVFLDEAFVFLNSLDKKHYGKILYNIRKAQTEQDPRLFKKLNGEIWDSGHFSKVYNIACLHFGTNPILKILWLFQPTVL